MGGDRNVTDNMNVPINAVAQSQLKGRERESTVILGGLWGYVCFVQSSPAVVHIKISRERSHTVMPMHYYSGSLNTRQLD